MLPKCIFQSNKTNIIGHWEALLETLAAEEKGRLAQVASNQRKTEARILGTPEAAGVVIPQATLIARLDKIRRRYEDAAALDAGLEHLGLSRDDLAAAVTRDLYVEAVVRAPALLRRAVVRATADRWEANVDCSARLLRIWQPSLPFRLPGPRLQRSPNREPRDSSDNEYDSVRAKLARQLSNSRGGLSVPGETMQRARPCV